MLTMSMWDGDACRLCTNICVVMYESFREIAYIWNITFISHYSAVGLYDVRWNINGTCVIIALKGQFLKFYWS